MPLQNYIKHRDWTVAQLLNTNFTMNAKHFYLGSFGIVLFLGSFFFCSKHIGKTGREPTISLHPQADSMKHPFHETIVCKAGEKTVRVIATGNCHLEGNDVFVQNAISSVAKYFALLDWPENEAVFLEETDEAIVITWPLPPEIANEIIYKPDYTARAELDAKTMKVIRYLEG